LSPYNYLNPPFLIEIPIMSGQVYVCKVYPVSCSGCNLFICWHLKNLVWSCITIERCVDLWYSNQPKDNADIVKLVILFRYWASPSEAYSRNASCALNSISTFSLAWHHHQLLASNPRSIAYNRANSVVKERYNFEH
jgi:hypothetical protein